MLSNILKRFYNNALYQNSFYLILNTALLSFFGFFFWIIASRNYSNTDVGLATALISSSNLVSSFSLLGFNVGLIRYLPSVKDKNEFIQTAITLVLISTVIFSLIFLVFLPYYSPKISYLTSSFIYILLFVFSVVVMSLISLCESIFISFRAAKFIVIYNLIFSILKLILILFLNSSGSIGIYASIFFASLSSLLIAVVILLFNFKLSYRFIVKFIVIKKVFVFSFNNFLASFIGTLPIMVLPILITNLLNPRTSAYYYMPMMIMSFLYIIPIATTKSLMAESSHDESKVLVNFLKAIKLILILMLPAILIVIFAGQYILLAFGSEYSTEGITFLRLLSVSGIFAAVTYLGGTYLNMKKKTFLIVLINLITTIIIISCSYLFINKGLIGIGLSWLLGHFVASIIHALILTNDLLLKNNKLHK